MGEKSRDCSKIEEQRALEDKECHERKQKTEEHWCPSQTQR